MRKLVLTILVTSMLLFVACSIPSTSVPALEPTPVPATMSSDEAFFMIIERLQNLAKTSEAKEYVALLFPPLSHHSEYSEDLKAWVILVETLRSEAREGLSEADWFYGDAIQYLDRLDEAAWVVYDDGRIVSVAGGALLIETHIEQLNTTGILGTPPQTHTQTTVPGLPLSPTPVPLSPAPPRYFPITYSFTLSPLDEETLDKYSEWFPSQYPFNNFGVYINRFSFEAIETLDIVITSDQPITIEMLDEFWGGIYVDIQYMQETGSRASSNWYESYDIRKSGNNWEARIKFKPDETGVYSLVLTNRSGKSSWCQYTISLHAASSTRKINTESEATEAVLNYLNSLATTSDAKQLLVDFQENVSDTHIGVIDSQGVDHWIEDYQGQEIDAYAIGFVFLDGENLHGVLGDEIIEMHGEDTVHYRYCNWLVELDGTVQPLNNNAHRVEFELMPSNSLVWTYPELHQLHQFGISAEPDFFHETVPREILENPEWEPKELEERVIELAREYEKAHPYAEPNHVCLHMAVELWQVFKDNNITSMIVVGNTEAQEEWAKLFASDHVWLIVLGQNNLNLGVECTSGIVYSPSYMRVYEIDCELACQEYGPSSPQWETAKARYDREYDDYEQHLEGYFHRSPANLITSVFLFFIP